MPYIENARRTLMLNEYRALVRRLHEMGSAPGDVAAVMYALLFDVLLADRFAGISKARGVLESVRDEFKGYSAAYEQRKKNQNGDIRGMLR